MAGRPGSLLGSPGMLSLDGPGTSAGLDCGFHFHAISPETEGRLGPSESPP